MNYHDILFILKDFERVDKQCGGQYTDFTKPQRFIKYLSKRKRAIDVMLLTLQSYYIDTIESERLEAQDTKRIKTMTKSYFRLDKQAADNKENKGDNK